MDQQELAREISRPEVIPVVSPDELEREALDIHDDDENDGMLRQGEILRLGFCRECEEI